MRYMRKFYIFFYIILLSGCLTAPPHEAIQHQAGPYPENFESMIKDYLQFHLKVPESLKDFTINKSPEIVILDTYYPWIPLNEGQEVWQCFVVYDAKNEQGVYVGRKLHVVWFRHNRIIAFDYKELELEYQIEERIKNPGY